MAISTVYRLGLASVTADGTTVTGAGTQWLAAGLQPGDVFCHAGLSVGIASINPDGTLTLTDPWPGAGAVSQPYEIRLTPDATRVLTSAREALRRIAEGDLIDLASVDFVAGAPGSQPSYSGGVLTIPSGKNGAVDFGDLTIATGAAGTNVVYDEITGTMTIPRGADGDVTEAQLNASTDRATVPAALLAEATRLLDPVVSVTEDVGDDLDRVPLVGGLLELMPPYPAETCVAASVRGRPAVGALMGRAPTRMRLVDTGTSTYRGLLPATGDWTLILAHRTSRGDVPQEVLFQGRSGSGTFNLLVNCELTSNNVRLEPDTYMIRWSGVADGNGGYAHTMIAPAKSGDSHVVAIVKADGAGACKFAVDGVVAGTFTAPATALTATDFHIFAHSGGKIGSAMGDPGGQDIGRLVMIPRALTDDELAWVSEWVGRSMGLGSGTGTGSGVEFVPITAAEYAALTEAQRNDPAIMYLVTA